MRWLNIYNGCLSTSQELSEERKKRFIVLSYRQINKQNEMEFCDQSPAQIVEYEKCLEEFDKIDSKQFRIFTPRERVSYCEYQKPLVL